MDSFTSTPTRTDWKTRTVLVGWEDPLETTVFQVCNEPSKKIYTGIGSRSTPLGIQELMTEFASAMDSCGWTLRSGGADGADLAFERGSLEKEIYLPYKGFNRSDSQLFRQPKVASKSVDIYHPAPNRLTPVARKMMARNWCQICGGGEESVLTDFVVCWSLGGLQRGGTSQALRIAKDLGVPYFNLSETDRPDKMLCNIFNRFTNGYAYPSRP